MTISSRTPEGDPNSCPVCGHNLRLEPSIDTRDGPCPLCGHLLWFVEVSRRSSESELHGMSYEGLILRMGKERLGPLSLDLQWRLIQAVAALSQQVKLPALAEMRLFVSTVTTWNQVVLFLEALRTIRVISRWRQAGSEEWAIARAKSLRSTRAKARWRPNGWRRLWTSTGSVVTRIKRLFTTVHPPSGAGS
jgi:hypothetical protein